MGPLDLNLSSALDIEFIINSSGVEPCKLGLTDEWCPEST